MTCSGCKYFMNVQTVESVLDVTNAVVPRIVYHSCYCRRYPARVESGPGDWCGEFKAMGQDVDNTKKEGGAT